MASSGGAPKATVAKGTSTSPVTARNFVHRSQQDSGRLTCAGLALARRGAVIWQKLAIPYHM